MKLHHLVHQHNPEGRRPDYRWPTDAVPLPTGQDIRGWKAVLVGTCATNTAPKSHGRGDATVGTGVVAGVWVILRTAVLSWPLSLSNAAPFPKRKVHATRVFDRAAAQLQMTMMHDYVYTMFLRDRTTRLRRL